MYVIVRLSLGSSSVTFEAFVFQVLRFVDSDNLCTGFLLIHLSKQQNFGVFVYTKAKRSFHTDVNGPLVQKYSLKPF